MVEIYFWNTSISLHHDSLVCFFFVFLFFKTIFFVTDIIRVIADSLELLCEKNTLGLSSKLFDSNNVSNPAFTSLNPYYKIITYEYGPKILYYGFNKMKILQLSGREISNWKTKKMMRFFYDIGLFSWWYRERDLTWMYFKSLSDIWKAENYIRSKYSQTKFIRI